MIEFNGQKYSSVEAMPPEVRREYEKAMEMLKRVERGGLADFPMANGQTKQRVVVSELTITVDGKTYHSEEEMPPEVRQRYEEAMGRLRQAVEAEEEQPPTAFTASLPGDESVPAARQMEAATPIAPPASPVVQEARTSVSGLLVLVAVVVLLLLVFAGLVVLVLR